MSTRLGIIEQHNNSKMSFLFIRFYLDEVFNIQTTYDKVGALVFKILSIHAKWGIPLTPAQPPADIVVNNCAFYTTYLLYLPTYV